MISIYLFIIAVLLHIMLKPPPLPAASLGLGKKQELSPCEMVLFPYTRNSANLIKIGGEAFYNYQWDLDQDFGQWGCVAEITL